LIVATIEPRKGHIQTIQSFEELWKTEDINLVIVGKEGWKGLEDEKRRTIPQIINKIKSHKELNKRLFWLENISDEFLEEIYKISTALIAPSQAEGFGLPLIEAAQSNIPIIARDIKVFQEVAKEFAYYFNDDDNPKTISEAIKNWLELYKADKHPKSHNIPWLTWQESTKILLDKILIP
jgi:glycosyltransferase involved in cell wall biosynthesis